MAIGVSVERSWLSRRASPRLSLMVRLSIETLLIAASEQLAQRVTL